MSAIPAGTALFVVVGTDTSGAAVIGRVVREDDQWSAVYDLPGPELHGVRAVQRIAADDRFDTVEAAVEWVIAQRAR